ncbi:MAG TPA: S53 family peptidase [Streptosporangiaceae bacterium]|nr:S53 family peptidase [Streptosporangiaceae bacterium]
MPDEPGSLVQLPGSERAALPGAKAAGPLDTTARAEVTLVLRRRAELPDEVVAGPGVLTSDELAERYGADPADVALVTQTLEGLGLQVTDVSPATRRVKVSGTLGDLSRAFGTTLQLVTSADATGRQVTHRYRTGSLYVPAALDGVVTAVLGLDTRPSARPHFRPQAATQGTSYTPVQVADVYQFPAGTTGAGQTVAVIELGGGFETSDLTSYFGELGIPVPSITAVSVDGASNAPGSDPTGADVEVALDIQVIGAAAPGAAQLVYFAPNNGDQGFVDAISDASTASPAPIAISISWGESEDSWTAQGRQAMDSAIADAAAMGITVCVAAGDNGSGDAVTDGQPHCDFPASSPHALGCGGTKLVADPSTGVITSEVVWNETASNEGAGGGGVSDQFALPTWQATAGVPVRAAGTTTTTTTTAGQGGAAAAASEHNEHHEHHEHRGHKAGEHESHRHHGGSGGAGGSSSGGAGGSSAGGSGGSAAGGTVGRGVPDVAGNADPTTGYQIMSDGQSQVVGGTSAVAPLWSALIARLAQATGQRFGLIQTALYAGITPGTDVPGFRDITSGNNGAYAAGPGWDACSGLGVPVGTDLLTVLQG